MNRCYICPLSTYSGLPFTTISLLLWIEYMYNRMKDRPVGEALSRDAI